MDRRLTAILSGDIEGYSRLVRADEEHAVREVQANLAAATAKIEENGGRLIDTAGDGFLAEFASVVAAVRCAVAIQEIVNRRNEGLPPDRRAAFRVGVNQGEVVVENGRIFGDGINVAARLQAVAEPGGIAITGRVYEDVAGKIAIEWADMGEQTFKNIGRTIRAYRSVRSGAERDVAPAQAEMPARSIIVLPFTNMSGDVEQEYFSDGITEDLITDLSKVSELHVIARNTAFTFKGRSIRVDHISRELGVRYVLEGSVRKAGNRVRITAQLLDGASGTHAWAERFDRDLVDIFAVQDEIAKSIVDALKVRILPRELEAIAGRSTLNSEAYEYYLQGRAKFSDGWGSSPAIKSARDLFSRAVDIDPGYAKAYAGIVCCDAFLWVTGNLDISVEKCSPTATWR